MTAQPRPTHTPEQYLARERASEQKSEYYAGEIYAMAGGSQEHNLISGNVYASLHAQLRRRPCTVYPSDMRVWIPRFGVYTYPDISAVCGEPLFHDMHRDILLNPMVLIEVLSPSTEKYDRGKKFQFYRTLDALQEYILIEQDAYHLERYIRQPSNRWLLEEYTMLTDEVYLTAIDCRLLLEDIYEKVALDDQAPLFP